MEKKTFGDMAKRLFAAYLEQKIKVKRKSKNKLINIKTVLL